MKLRIFSLFSALFGLLALGFAPATAQDAGVVNVYSARHYGAVEASFDAFTAATGIQVRVSQGSPQALLERLRAEGEYSPADVLLSIDAGVLSLAAEEGLLQAVDSEVLTANIPAEYRDPENRWFGLSIRARSVAYNPTKVAADEITSYADLADPKWAGRLCMRPATHIYTISLVGGLIGELGAEEAERVVAGWVANNPIYIDSDTRMLENVIAGACDAAIVNHYYLARMHTDTPETIEQVKLAWVGQGEEQNGVFFNVNGAGVTTSAVNVENAIAFIEYYATLDGQAPDATGLPGGNYEYPTNPEAALHPALEELGVPKFNTSFALWEYGAAQAPALDLLEKVGYGFAES